MLKITTDSELEGPALSSLLLGSLRQEDHEFQASLDNSVEPCISQGFGLRQAQSTVLSSTDVFLFYIAEDHTQAFLYARQSFGP